MIVLGSNGEIATIEKDDGTWWVHCTCCGNDKAFAMPLPGITVGESTPEQKRERIAPVVSFKVELQCTRCRTPTILRRFTVEVKI
jgi:hypothetical protein